MEHAMFSLQRPRRVVRVLTATVGVGILTLASVDRAAADPITMTTYTDSGYYYFSYPSTCDVSWDTDNGWVAAWCPISSPFRSYQFSYGSGNKYQTVDSLRDDDVPSNGQWQKYDVDVTPHPSNPSCYDSPGNTWASWCWTNFKIVPEFESPSGLAVQPQ
jgi:hypothetical protein